MHGDGHLGLEHGHLILDYLHLLANLNGDGIVLLDIVSLGGAQAIDNAIELVAQLIELGLPVGGHVKYVRVRGLDVLDRLNHGRGRMLWLLDRSAPGLIHRGPLVVVVVNDDVRHLRGSHEAQDDDDDGVGVSGLRWRAS